MRKKIFVSALVLVLPVFLGACGSGAQKVSEKAAENMAEKALEDSTGGKADVDIDDENVSIETNQGSMQAGENVKLPENFPSDVYVYDGKITAFAAINESNGFNVTIEADKAVAEVKAAYEKKIVEDGWEITGSLDMAGTISIVGEKGSRSLSVMIRDNEGKTMVVVTVMEDK